MNEIAEFVAQSGIRNLDDVKQTATHADFLPWLASEVQHVNDQIVVAETEVRRLAVGQVDNLHHVMLELEKAITSMQLLTQVRNKVLEGYQEVMRMQV